MTGGWGKPSVGGTALRIPAINSPNFNLTNPLSSPSPSWAILQSGIAYFFGLVLSGGTITGPDYIINTAGAFFYSGSPALGNLIVSIAGAAGVDAFGNVFPQGINVTKGQFSGSNYVINSLGFFLYSGTPALGNLVASVTAASGADDGLGNAFKADVTVYGTSGTYVQMLASGIAALNVGSGDAAEVTPAKLTSGIFGSGGPRFIQTILSSARVSGQNALSNLQVILEGEAVDHSFGNDLRIEGSSQTGAEGFRITLEAVDGATSMLFSGTGVAGNMLDMDVTNKKIVFGYPISGPSGNSQGTAGPESWNTLGALSGTGSANLTINAGRYRVTAQGECEIDIVLTATGTTTAGGNITFATTLPSAYRFTTGTQRSYPVGFNGAVTTATNTATLRVSSGGVVALELPSVPVNTVISVTQHIPLD